MNGLKIKQKHIAERLHSANTLNKYINKHKLNMPKTPKRGKGELRRNYVLCNAVISCSFKDTLQTAMN